MYGPIDALLMPYRCEAKANDWGQRSKMRNDDVEALAKALKILGDRVKRALLLAESKKGSIAIHPKKGHHRGIGRAIYLPGRAHKYY